MGLEQWAQNRYPDRNINVEPQTPKERMEQMRKLNDDELNQKLAQWEMIRANQESGMQEARIGGDVLNLELLFKGINDDRKRLGLKELLLQGELP